MQQEHHHQQVAPPLLSDPGDPSDLRPLLTYDDCSSINSTSTAAMNCSPSTTPPFVDVMPPSFSTMSDLSFYCVIAYSIIFLVSATGNISVFCSVYKQLRHAKNRISLLILHLCIADLVVTFTAMPLEVIWRVTIQWYGGDVMCKVCQFLRAFGLYASSMVVICISLDRYFAIIYPLKLARAAERAKITLGIAWLSALICAAPQSIIFHVEQHPRYPFKQCVTEAFLRSDVEQELVYNVFSVSVLYFVPLLIIIFTYARILLKISHKLLGRQQPQDKVAFSTGNHRNKKKPSVTIIPHNGVSPTEGRQKSTSTEDDDDDDDMDDTNLVASSNNNSAKLGPNGASTSLRPSPNCDGTETAASSSAQTPPPPQQLEEVTLGQKMFLRTSISGGVLMARARIRTLRLTAVIVLTFVFCWTPYVVMTLWYMIDREGAKLVDKRLQEGLFLMAVSNSVANPLIYGTYGSSDCRRGSGGGNASRYGHYVTRKRNPSPSSQQRRSILGGGGVPGGATTMSSVILTNNLYPGRGGGGGGADRKTSVI